MAMNLQSLTELNEIQANLSPKIELIVLFFFDLADVICKRMKLYVGGWVNHPNYKDRVLFYGCNHPNCNRDILEKYNIKDLPAFAFIKNNEEAAPLYIASNLQKGPVEIETIIKGLIAAEKQ